MSTVSRVYTSVRGIQTAIKDAGRLRQIVGVLIKHGFGAFVTRLGLEDVIGVKGLMNYRDENEQPYSVARRIRMAIEDLGPTFIKLGQILSTRSDLVPADIIEELQFLQDDVPELPYEDIRTQVETELGAPIDELFSEFPESPLACASIAQVHRARLPDGTDVVVKVQRPGLDNRIDSDLNILHFLARRTEQLVPELALMDPVGIVEEFEKALRKELDFSYERSHIHRFQLNFENFEGVRIPRVYTSHSTSRVLTMETIAGVKITQAPAQLGIDPYDVAPRVLRMLFKMVFDDGYFHGDLHPGNILISKKGTIGLIDFGLVGKLTPKQRDAILDILIGLSRPDYELVARIFFELGIKVPGVIYNYEAFERDVIEVMENHVEDKTLSEIDVGALFGELVTGAIRHQIKMPPTYTMVFKALMTIEGIGKTLAPEVNFIEEAQPFVRDMLVERYSPRRLIRETVETLGSLSRFLSIFPQTATELLRSAERGELHFKLGIDDLNTLVEAQRKSAQRVSRAVGFAACIVGAALTVDVDLPSVAGMSWLAFVLLLMSLLFGLPLIGTSLRRGR